MTGKLQRTNINFVRATPNYLLLFCGGLVLFCLLVGLLMSVMAKNLGLAIVFLISAISLSAFAILNLREVKKIAVRENIKKVDWDISLPDNQRKKLTVEVLELSRLLDVSDEDLPDLLSAYIVAEDLAIRQIQQEAKMPVMRHVSIAETPFDAVLIKNDLITCIEVSFLVTPEISQQKIDWMLRKISTVNQNFKDMKLDPRVRLLLVLVTQLDQEGEAKLRSTLVSKFNSTTVDVDIRLLDFGGLQKIYAME
ncbi:MAG TPA: hypothetical protein PKY59_11510 [Pyrinomonadaceae bacterium]|nr:hypothetical protein [Pyrinomonadaceae bacterium]